MSGNDGTDRTGNELGFLGRYLTLFINWAVKPFKMYGIAILFLGFVFRGLIGFDAVDLVKISLRTQKWFAEKAAA